jgi:hypothetical protein
VFARTGQLAPGDPSYLVKRICAVPGDPVPDQAEDLMANRASCGRIPSGWLLLQGMNSSFFYSVPVDAVVGKVVGRVRASAQLGPTPARYDLQRMARCHRLQGIHPPRRAQLRPCDVESDHEHTVAAHRGFGRCLQCRPLRCRRTGGHRNGHALSSTRRMRRPFAGGEDPGPGNQALVIYTSQELMHHSGRRGPAGGRQRCDIQSW